MTLSSTLVNNPKKPFRSPATHQRGAPAVVVAAAVVVVILDPMVLVLFKSNAMCVDCHPGTIWVPVAPESARPRLGGLVMIAWRSPPGSRNDAMASIFGPM